MTGSKRRWVIRLGLAWSILLCVIAPCSWAQSSVSKEYQVKAVFLYNFTQFIQWPSKAFSKAEDPFRIGILGNDPFGAFLDQTVLGEKVNGHPLVIQRYGNIEDVKDCHILFVAQTENERLGKALADLREKGILTVGDSDGFLQNGGVILFFTKGNRVRFKVSLGAAKRAGLTISSKMLRLAEISESGKD